jgi:2-(1,2-epoxy-1,2-dihydrophenyl)acetyl-CoA isomerase
MQAFSTLRYEFDQVLGVARIKFERPDVLNAINLQMARELLSVVRDLGQREGLRCVTLSGLGRAFMAGGDVAAFAGGADKAARAIDDLLDCLNPAILKLRQLNAPILAGVHGVAAGAGLSLALLADVVLAAEGTRFLLAYDRIGAVPDCGGSWFLCQRAGRARANELMMLSRELDAAEAKAWGLVTAVAEKASFDVEFEALARKLAAGPSRAYAEFRSLLDKSAGCSFAEHLESERLAFLAITQTKDFEEGVRAFLEKRPPSFRGN